MTLDPEQIRRDAEWVIHNADPQHRDLYSAEATERLARHCLALLDTLEQAEQQIDGDGPQISMGTASGILQAEVAAREAAEARAEQAERERDEWQKLANRNLNEWFNGRDDPRLAAVPALVEAATKAAAIPIADGRMLRLRAALDAYHQASTPPRSHE